MFLLRIFIIISVVLFVIGFVTQVLTPVATGTTLFPLFRHKRSAILNEMAEIKAQLDDKDLEIALAALKQQLKDKQEAELKKS